MIENTGALAAGTSPETLRVRCGCGHSCEPCDMTRCNCGTMNCYDCVATGHCNEPQCDRNADREER